MVDIVSAGFMASDAIFVYIGMKLLDLDKFLAGTFLLGSKSAQTFSKYFSNTCKHLPSIDTHTLSTQSTHTMLCLEQTVRWSHSSCLTLWNHKTKFLFAAGQRRRRPRQGNRPSPNAQTEAERSDTTSYRHEFACRRRPMVTYSIRPLQTHLRLLNEYYPLYFYNYYKPTTCTHL